LLKQINPTRDPGNVGNSFNWLSEQFSISSELGKLDNIHLAFFGEIAHYRPVNSLAKLLSLFKNVHLSFVSAPEVKLQDGVRRYLVSHNIKFEEIENIENVIGKIDVLYVTRVKKEYMSDELYQKIQGKYVVDKKLISHMKKESLIMHPLPRIGEIAVEVDKDRRAVYLNKQMRNGMYTRMALLDMILRK